MPSSTSIPGERVARGMYRGLVSSARRVEKARLKSFPKLSGSKGLQLYVPLNTRSSYAATQPFAKTMAELLEREHPKLVVADMAKNLRRGKVFVDWSQNADHKTTVGVYSLRAKHERPFVSIPIQCGS